MSKRVRGTRRQGPARRPDRAARPARPVQAATLAPVNELAEAAEPNAMAPRAAAARPASTLPRGGPVRQSALAARAATEYVYVGQDLRHIAILASVIGGVLVVLWLVIDVLRLIQL